MWGRRSRRNGERRAAPSEERGESHFTSCALRVARFLRTASDPHERGHLAHYDDIIISWHINDDIWHTQLDDACREPRHDLLLFREITNERSLFRAKRAVDHGEARRFETPP